MSAELSTRDFDRFYRDGVLIYDLRSTCPVSWADKVAYLKRIEPGVVIWHTPNRGVKVKMS